MNYGTILSYATESSDNMLTLTDYNGFVLYVNGSNIITDITLNDGEWHFVCVNWQSGRGNYDIFIDGRLSDSGTSLSAGEAIEAGGTLIIGQEQVKWRAYDYLLMNCRLEKCCLRMCRTKTGQLGHRFQRIGIVRRAHCLLGCVESNDHFR